MWVKSIVAIIALIVGVIIFTVAVFETDLDLIFEFGTIILVIALAIYAVVWAGNYIVTGQRAGFLHVFQMIFGTPPRYLWFVLVFLYVGGLASAYKSGLSSSSLLWDAFAQGVGASVAIILLGSIGRLYRHDRFIGHVLASVIIGIVAFAAT